MGSGKAVTATSDTVERYVMGSIQRTASRSQGLVPRGRPHPASAAFPAKSVTVPAADGFPTRHTPQ